MTEQTQGLSNLISALDNTKLMRAGENDHAEYDWNGNDLKEQLVQLSFQTVRADFTTRCALIQRFIAWVSAVLTPAFYAGQTTLERRRAAIALSLYGYKMVAHLRDVDDGKGECRLAYDMLFAWYEGVMQASRKVANSGATSLANTLAEMANTTTIKLAKRFMFTEGDNTQFGSFKDFKYLCHEFALLHLAFGSETEDQSSEANDGQYREATDKCREVNGQYREATDKCREVYNKFIQRQRIRKPKNPKHTIRAGTETFRFTPDLIKFLSEHPVISALASAYGSQIHADYANILNADAQAHVTNSAPSYNITLAGKWAPRASSKLFAPLRTLLFTTVVPEGLLWKETAQSKDDGESRRKAEIKIETVYRQRLSAINKALETVQVKQCTKKWANIDFDKNMTSVTLARQKKAFMKGGDEDRDICKQNFAAFMERVKQGTSKAKGKRIAISDFVKEALNLAPLTNQYANPNSQDTINAMNEAALLDKQWADKGDNLNLADNLGDMIAMVDTSGSMTCDDSYPLHTAIGLGIRIAEKSRLGNRVMTFSARPKWINLANKPSFVDRVCDVQHAEWGMNTNFQSALRLILEAAINAKLTAQEVAKLSLVILSDMQMDAAGDTSTPLFARIKREFADAGTRVCGEPYPVPKIIFWNLRTTEGFPSTSTDENAIMVSGGSDAILKDLCENGVTALTNINPWNAFVDMMDKERYASFNHMFEWWMV